MKQDDCASPFAGPSRGRDTGMKCVKHYTPRLREGVDKGVAAGVATALELV